MALKPVLKQVVLRPCDRENEPGMTKYYLARGETLPLNAQTRRWLRGSFVELSDGVTHYELTGPAGGEVVFLVGSLTVPLFYWDDVVSALHEQGLRTLAYSSYGRGYSDRIVGHYDRDLLVRQAHELLKALGLNEPWHLVGASMGALIALALLADSHEQTRSLTMIGPAGFTDGDAPPVKVATSQLLSAFLGKRFGQALLRSHLSHNVRTPEQVKTLTDMVCDSYRCEGSIYALLATLRDYPLHRQHGLYAQAAKLGIPTLLLWGEGDRVTPIGKFQEVADLLRPSRSRILSDCGHMVAFEYPGETAREMAAFYAGL
jgi:pimeloyl-ACP methyl ester carboxylesterase